MKIFNVLEFIFTLQLNSQPGIHNQLIIFPSIPDWNYFSIKKEVLLDWTFLKWINYKCVKISWLKYHTQWLNHKMALYWSNSIGWWCEAQSKLESLCMLYVFKHIKHGLKWKQLELDFGCTNMTLFTYGGGKWIWYPA